VLKVLRV